MTNPKICLARLIIAVLVLLPALEGWAAGGLRMRAGVLRRAWDEMSLPAGSSQLSRVGQFIAQNRRLLGLTADPELVLTLEGIVTTAVGQRYVYAFQAHGLPVFETHLILLVAEDKIRSIFNSAPTADLAKSTPFISTAEALNLAEEALNQSLFRSDPQIELGYSSDGTLIYRLRLPGLKPPADWEVWIDAQTGDVLKKVDRRLFIDGTGRIFDPDPKTTTGDNTLTDQNDANAAIPEAAYTTVTLPQLFPAVGGYYYLDGPYVSTALTSNRAAEVTPNFNYWRQDDRFEEVMVYYHIDHQQTYFQTELQTPNANNRQQVCNVNGTPDDNSWYSPYSRNLTFGYGGVDDAEDADVILHEYGHAIQDDINRFWSGGHTGAMGEGFGDYLAGVYSLAVNPNFQPNWVFNWDGHNEFWSGRILNANYHYPENAGGEIHDSGQLWSAGLLDVWWDISDRIAWERMVLQHHFLLGNGATMADAAEAIIVTELALYQGIYRQLIVDDFSLRGFINPINYYPQITSIPLPDTEDTLQTEFEVAATITSSIPLQTSSLQLFWRTDTSVYQILPLVYTGTPHEYHAYLPGPFNENLISYYLSAADTLEMASFLPAEAPMEAFQFYVGLDTNPPEVLWVDSLGPTVFITLSHTIRAQVTDNLGISSVELFWKIDEGSWQSAPMLPVVADTFQGTLTYVDQEFEQTVSYYVHAVDASSQQNSSNSPVQSFPISSSVSLEDFEGQLASWTFDGQWGLTTQYAHSSSHSLEDSPNQTYPPNSDTWAQWGEAWDLSDLTRATLTFWEMHLLEAGHDWGFFEVSSGNGPWIALFEISGVDANWHQREISLDEFCGGATQSLQFRFRVVTDDSGNLFGWIIDDLGVFVEVIVPIGTETLPSLLPEKYTLQSISPNPCNAQTTITLALPQNGNVTLKLYNCQGQMVKSLMSGLLEAGIHRILFNANALTSGIYFCQMQAGDFCAVKKVVLLK